MTCSCIELSTSKYVGERWLGVGRGGEVDEISASRLPGFGGR
jgi:hypothetical protein